MARIVGIDIPDKKRIVIALTSIYGIGISASRKILKELKINEDKKASELTSNEVNKLKNIIEKNYKVEGDLRRETMMNIKRLKEIDSWRGFRHQKGLPVRGQRTKTNSRTIRGNVKKTVGSGRRGAPSPK